VINSGNTDKQVGLYLGGLIFGGGGPYIWSEVSVSTYGGLIHTGAYIWGGGLYSEVYGISCMYNLQLLYILHVQYNLNFLQPFPSAINEIKLISSRAPVANRQGVEHPDNSTKRF
jgi:hypothetical protein